MAGADRAGGRGDGQDRRSHRDEGGTSRTRIRVTLRGSCSCPIALIVPIVSPSCRSLSDFFNSQAPLLVSVTFLPRIPFSLSYSFRCFSFQLLALLASRVEALAILDPGYDTLHSRPCFCARRFFFGIFLVNFPGFSGVFFEA